MYDIVAVGEALIDISSVGIGELGVPLYDMHPSGAPCHCVAACVALGGTAAVIGAVGNDIPGQFYRQRLREKGIEDSGLQTVEDVHTTLVISNRSGANAQTNFFRDPGADTQLQEGALAYALIDECRSLHFGSLSLCHDPSCAATLAAAAYARSKGVRICYDPNYRALLWKDREKALEAMKKGLRYANVVKLSQQEMELILGVPSHKPEDGVRQLFALGADTCYITYGKKGAYYADSTARGFAAGFPVDTLDAIGCGDAFIGAALFLELHQPELGIAARTRLANAVGAICASQRGGMVSVSGMDALQAFLEKHAPFEIPETAPYA